MPRAKPPASRLRIAPKNRDKGDDMAIIAQRNALSRRGFLVGSSAVAIGAGFAHRAGVGAALAQDAPRQPGEAAWRLLADKMSGPVLRAESFDLRKVAKPYNLRYAGDLPDAVALCRDAADVALAIKWCTENRFPLVVQSGGHSYAGFSMRQGGLMINLTLMRAAKVANGLATVAGGVRNTELYTLLAQNGAAITHGRCPTVGAAGFLLGGGIGFNMRTHGAACDQLVESEIVTADGRIRTIRPDGDEMARNLFWACQGGGGGNFGINTSFTVNTFAAGRLTMFDLTWTAATPATDKVAAALITALEGAPIAMGLGTRLSLKAPHPRDRALGANVAISLIGQLTDRPGALEQLLAPAYAIAKPQQSLIRGDTPYWEAQKLLEDDDGPTFFQERSAFAAPGQAVEVIEPAFRFLRSWPGTSGGADLRFFQTGGKMNARRAGDTAFVHRNTEWIMDVGLSWNASEDWDAVRRSRIWQDELYGLVRSQSTGGAYQNFIDPSLKDWQSAYYGDNLARLRDIKTAVDRDSLFTFPQAIPPRQ
jgi:hypothetical protein